jgi:hypothetical protein
LKHEQKCTKSAKARAVPVANSQLGQQYSITILHSSNVIAPSHNGAGFCAVADVSLGSHLATRAASVAIESGLVSAFFATTIGTTFGEWSTLRVLELLARQ